MSDTIVIYHHPCQDGFTAAWACWTKHPDWEYIPYKHGDSLNVDIVGKDVFILDLSFISSVLEEMCAKAKQVVAIDHHVTGISRFKAVKADNFKYIYDINKSGAMLAWEYFCMPVVDLRFVPPRALYLIQDNDLHEYIHHDTKPVCEYLYSLPYSFPVWEKAIERIQNEHDRDYVISIGNSLLQYKENTAHEFSKYKFRMRIYGYEVWAINAPYTMQQHLHPLLSEAGKQDSFTVSFWYDGNKTVFSLRSKEDGPDVSAIAQHYGGGGHKHASGFEILGPSFVEGTQHNTYPIRQINK